MEKIRFYRTGQVVRDIGIISFHKYLNAIDKSDLDINLTENYLEFNKFATERLIKYIKDYFKKNNKVGFPYIGNSSRFGSNNLYKDKKDKKSKVNVQNNSSNVENNNEHKDERLYQNLIDMFNIVFAINNVDLKKQKDILQKYEPSEQCTICHTFLATKRHYSAKEQDLVKRKEDKTIYSFSGPENNTYNYYCKTNTNICFTCELLNLFFLLYIDEYKLNMIGYCERLIDLDYINYKLLVEQKMYKADTIYLKLSKLNRASIRIYELERNPKKGIVLKFNNLFNINALLKNLKLIAIIEKYRYNVKNDSSVKHLDNLKQYIKTLIFNNNSEIINQILLSHLISNDSDSDDKYTNTIQNIKSYNKFLEGGFEMEINSIKSNIFFDTGNKLAIKIDKDKKRTIAFRLTQLMKSDSREQLFNELLGLLVTYEVEIPQYFSCNILKSRSIDFNYNIGRLLEGLNNKELINLMGGNEDE